MNVIIPIMDGLEVLGYLVGKSERIFTDGRIRNDDWPECIGIEMSTSHDTSGVIKSMRSDYILTIVKKIKSIID